MYEDRKEKFIKRIVKSKEEAIQLSTVNRDAILLTTSSPVTMALSDDEIKKKIHEWRMWLWKENENDPEDQLKKEIIHQEKFIKPTKEILGF